MSGASAVAGRWSGLAGWQKVACAAGVGAVVLGLIFYPGLFGMGALATTPGPEPKNVRGTNPEAFVQPTSQRRTPCPARHQAGIPTRRRLFLSTARPGRRPSPPTRLPGCQPGLVAASAHAAQASTDTGRLIYRHGDGGRRRSVRSGCAGQAAIRRNRTSDACRRPSWRIRTT